jgi:adenylate cyclase
MKLKLYLVLAITMLITMPGVAQGQHDDVIKITGENFNKIDFDTIAWKYKAGDNTLWAAKDFNDADWNTALPTINTQKVADSIGFKGSAWFRIHVHADSTIVDKPILLDIDSKAGWEVYYDGKLVRKNGTLGSKKQSDYDKTFFPAVFVIPDTGVHVFAIRFENKYYKDMLTGPRRINAGFSLGIWDYYDYISHKKDGFVFSSLFFLISGGIFLALFLSHLVMYFVHKKYKANLIFSLFNLGLGVFFITGYVSIFIESMRLQYYILPLFVLAPAVSFLMLNILVNRLFFWSWIRFGISALFLLVISVLAFANYGISIVILLLYLTYTILEAAIMVVIALRKKIPGAKILSFGILSSFVLFAFLTIGGMFGKLNYEGYAGLVVIVVSMLTIFSLPLSMSGYLAWSFAMVNKNLAIQLDKVSELSQRTIEQEQEKQRILEGQKDELEKQVAARTSELTLQKEALAMEKKKSDDLLLNILPAEVAEELKETGKTHAQSFDHVSVLFTDFVNFTQMAEQLSPQELVAELHECFRAFDDIMERNNMEKIKTIGDAYLAVSGMPVASEHHAVDAVKAGFEIVDFINQRNSNGGSFKVRVGINSGPLVAGIVGVKKFAYDIWGDTVNTASRMESNSEAGRINISKSTYELVKHRVACTYRGKINAKNKGEVDMYFVESIIA